MKIEGEDGRAIDGLGIPGAGLVKRAAKGVGRGFKKGAKYTYKGGKFAVKLHVRAFLKLNKFALQGMCKLPGPLRAAAVGAAITAGTGGAGGAAAPMVSQAAADAICRAMSSGKKSDADAAERALDRDGIAFAKPTIWEEISYFLGLG